MVLDSRVAELENIVDSPKEIGKINNTNNTNTMNIMIIRIITTSERRKEKNHLIPVLFDTSLGPIWKRPCDFAPGLALVAHLLQSLLLLRRPRCIRPGFFVWG